MRVLQAFSGWLAALFLLGFVAMGVVFVVESPAASLGLGLAMIGAAYGLFRKARSDVLEHLALAVSLAGQLLIAWASVAFLGRICDFIMGAGGVVAIWIAECPGAGNAEPASPNVFRLCRQLGALYGASDERDGVSGEWVRVVGADATLA
ncbi:hypothetical protein HORIV_13490 [Vreelandella olivaria]|uniref:DUF4401 domain-containing protein n=1 Tax=Vreelandella olivaria TaxID=390919 RepID=A0ABM7GEY2_9GAMM|nr:hypothetical protein HORIV_13490 [Halomonas olivaria]